MKSEGLLSAIGVLLLGILALSMLNDWDGQMPGLTRQQIEAPALIIEGMGARAYAADGHLQYQLHAREVIQFDHDNTLRVTQPVLTLRDPGVRWEVTAAHGELVEDGRLIVMRNGVRASYLAGEAPFELHTDTLRYRPREEILEIPTALQMLHQGGETRAGGLRAEMQTGIIELTNRVESRYVMP